MGQGPFVDTVGKTARDAVGNRRSDAILQQCLILNVNIVKSSRSRKLLSVFLRRAPGADEDGTGRVKRRAGWTPQERDGKGDEC